MNITRIARDADEGYTRYAGSIYELSRTSEAPCPLEGMMYLYNTPPKVLISFDILFETGRTKREHP